MNWKTSAAAVTALGALTGLGVLAASAVPPGAGSDGHPAAGWKAPSPTTSTAAAGKAAYGADAPALNGPLTPAMIDAAIRAQWKADAIVPAPPVDDARYLRRIYLDIVGSIPPPEAITAFLADRSPNKRAKAVEALLASPKYADNWTAYWDNVLMGRTVRAQTLDRVAWRDWLHSQFTQNTPWNKFVYDLVTATGVNSTGGSYAKVVGLKRTPALGARPLQAGQAGRAGKAGQNGQAAQMPAGQMPADQMAGMDADGGDPALNARVNGAVNWTLKYQNNYADLSGTASKIFLGVQIQCAQCHDHKTEKWKQEDFRRFTACFVAARPRPAAQYVKGRIRQVDLEDYDRAARMARLRMAARKNKKVDNTVYFEAEPTALDGTSFADVNNRRQALATWMISPENPWFAEAIVNRMWSHFLGRGFVEPVDDFRPSNPAVMPELMKQLADDFVASGYDVKHLIKTICATQVYQLSSQPARHADVQNKYWARYRLKPMGPEELMDSLVQATNVGPLLERVYGQNLDAIKFAMMRQFTFLFDVDEEFEQKDFEGTIPQALMLLNGGVTNKAVQPLPGDALQTVLAMPGGDAEKIEALYLRTLSRKPTATETAKWTEFVNAPRDVILPSGDPQPQMTNREARRAFQQRAKGAKRGGGGPDLMARVGPRFLPRDATPKQQAYEDLFWALLNSSEFMFNH